MRKRGGFGGGVTEAALGFWGLGLGIIDGGDILTGLLYLDYVTAREAKVTVRVLDGGKEPERGGLPKVIASESRPRKCGWSRHWLGMGNLSRHVARVSIILRR